MKIFWKKKNRITVDQLYRLFKRYFEGSASAHEREIVEAWLPREDRKNNLWYTDKIMEKDRVQLYRKLSERFEFTAKEANSLTSKMISRKFHLSPLFQTVAAASVIVIIGLSSMFYIHENRSANILHKELVATTGERSSLSRKFQLQDGSLVQMNAGSNLYFRKEEFDQQERELWFEGEAFFDVARNPDKAFLVHSDDLELVVHGTSFIIKSYHELGEYIVSVKSGKVEIISNDNSIARLTPGQQLVYKLKSGKVEIRAIHWEDVSAWMDGTLAFNNAHREELKLRLQQNFGMNLTFDKNVLSDVQLNARFPAGSSLAYILNNISKLYNFSYSINDKEVFIYPSE